MKEVACYVCGKVFKKKPSTILKRTFCSQKCYSSTIGGEGNPNYSSGIDFSFLDKIDEEWKAYLLGWIGSDGHIRKSGFCISIKDTDYLVLLNLAKKIGTKITFLRKRGIVTLTVNSQHVSERLCELFKIRPGKKSDIVQFPDLEEKYKIPFIRGYFDGDRDGGISSCQAAARKKGWPTPHCSISSNSPLMLSKIQDFFGGSIYKSAIEWNGHACLDFLSKIYDKADLRLNRKYDRYIDWTLWTPSLHGAKGNSDLGFRWIKSREDGIPPQKTRASDCGFDLSLIEKVKQNGIVEFYDTGIKVQPPYGYFFLLCARSSLVKTGYILANSVGVIDATYTGSILVPLIKIDKVKPDLELPARLVQLVPFPIVYPQLNQTTELSSTERGTGGFGSTGK
jgi:deoxyuridine 5'-triphosphate nucleotidohydrolase